MRHPGVCSGSVVQPWGLRGSGLRRGKRGFRLRFAVGQTVGVGGKASECAQGSRHSLLGERLGRYAPGMGGSWGISLIACRGGLCFRPKATYFCCCLARRCLSALLCRVWTSPASVMDAATDGCCCCPRCAHSLICIYRWCMGPVLATEGRRPQNGGIARECYGRLFVHDTYCAPVSLSTRTQAEAAVEVPLVVVLLHNKVVPACHVDWLIRVLATPGLFHWGCNVQ